MMKLSEYAKTLLHGTQITDKLLEFDTIEFDELSPFELPSLPGRCEQISFSEKQIQ